MKQNKTFIPDHLIANRPKVLKLIGKLAMKVTGWKTVGDFPKDERVLLVAGPHTSNWDFVLAMSLNIIESYLIISYTFVLFSQATTCGAYH